MIVYWQGWSDDRLAWNVSEFDDIDHTYVKLENVWVPDITMVNR